VLIILNKNNEVVYVKSTIDGKNYLVRNTKDKQLASNMLAKIKENIFMFVNYLHENKDKYVEMDKYITQLNKNIKNVTITESTKYSIYTSYSIEKGKEIVFCLRSKKNDKIHDLNLIMYVCIHELAHVACPEYDHTPLFKTIFAFFTEVAIIIGLYTKIKFYENPEEYCGLTITDSII
jgi:predicted metal-dependent hydrolase